MKTVTFDPAVYKLVPIRSASEMDSAADVSLYVGPWGASDIWDKMIAAVPDQLLVVEHSGEPIGFLYQGESAFSFVKPDAHPHILGALGAFPVFTHPAPSQPSDETMAEISQLKRECARLSAGWQQASYASQPSAEAIVQAALEAAAMLVAPYTENGARAIRAIDKQQIIESCKEKS